MSIAAIKIAQKEAGISDELYRDLLFRLTGRRSSKELNETQQRLVLDELRSRASGRVKTPTEAKIWALWYSFKYLLPIQQQRTTYLVGIVRKVAGRKSIRTASDFATLSPGEAYKVIEALKEKSSQINPPPF